MNFFNNLASAMPAFLGNYHATEDGDDSKPSPAPRRFEPGELTQGTQAEYLSNSNRCWMNCIVLSVDAETGAVTVNVRPNEALDLKEQKEKLRQRTKPRKSQLEWVRTVLRDGRAHEEAQEIFSRHATATHGKGTALQSDDALIAAGKELDDKLGISGSVCTLRYVMRHQQHLDTASLSFEGFGEAVWDLLWNVQRDFCQALPSETVAKLACEKDPRQVYNFEKALGEGSYGMVQLATHRTTKMKCAVKMIEKEGHHVGSAGFMEVEIEWLRLLDHPHVVKLYEHYQDSRYVYLVMDYCSGGDLQAAIKKRKQRQQNFPEDLVADIMLQVLLAISHVHNRGIVHLDLKPGNIMLTPDRKTLPPGRAPEGTTLASVQERPHVMVIDLGVAQIFRPGDFKYNKPSGTPSNMAPEVWKGEVHPKADVFSCGVVLFEMLGFALPFNSYYKRDQAIRYWNSMPAVPWEKVANASEHAVGLCRTMLMRTRTCRPSAAQCLQMPFIVELGSGLSSKGAASIPQQFFQNLALAPKRSVLYKSVALSIARVWPSNQLPTIKRVFHELDMAQNGRLAIEQLEEALQERGGLMPREAKEAARAMDLSCDGTVSWTEFIAMCIDLGSSTFDQDLQQIFDEADGDADGLLSQEDVSRLLAADHLREQTASRDVFAELRGRADEGARVDWPTFRGHFRGQGGGASAQAPAAKAEAPAKAFQPADLATSILEQARGAVGWARSAVFTEPVQPPAEKELRRLAEMGFKDRERCVAALQKHGNEVNDLVVQELAVGAANK